ncbi:MAG: fumarate hydratase C-terminal domain-containing protein [Euryarchaeota archaeon]|nr:fumarate hydratase C-terminal domain-containing protein [Euryarchaeota archaeon]
MTTHHLDAPVADAALADLRAGDRVEVTGTLYTARDAAHKRMAEDIQKGREPPIPLRGQVIYYVGPTPPRPGSIIGSAGPTTASRMDKYMEALLQRGLKATIGKGYRSPPVVEAMKHHRAVYLVAVGGTGALLSKHIRSVRVVAYEDLGTEAIREMRVERFPVVVGNDIYGGDVFQEGVKRYAEIQVDAKPRYE